MKTALMILAPMNFRDEEYYETKEVLEKHGIKVVTASETQIAESKEGKKEEVNFLLDEIEDAYDALIFVGGSGARDYYDNEQLHQLARTYTDEKRLVAAICSAPGILANAGVLKDKKATSFPDDQALLQSKGAILIQEDVVIDGHIITASGPPAAKAFGEAIAKKLKG